MKIMFTVQGEGRGHMTQAIAAHEMLKRKGHQLTTVLAGGNLSRSLPSFFEQAFGVPVRRMASPCFVQSKNRGISLLGTGADLFKSISAYRQSIATIESSIREFRPDLIINFLEPLMGVYNLLKRPKTPTLAVGHQFMVEHPAYLRVKEFPMQRIGMKNYVLITGARSAKVALSFYSAPVLPEKRLTVCPPILRRQLFDLTASPGSRLLVYLVFHGFSQDIVEWHKQHPEIPIDCFYDKPNAPAEEHYSETLTFHRLDGQKFLNMMAACRGIVCTAGFESVSEAAYLGKPILMVPVENHLEQFINARDAAKAGLGIRDVKFLLSRLLERNVPPAGEEFKAWVDRAEDIMMGAVAAAVEGGAAPESESLEAVARSCAI